MALNHVKAKSLKDKHIAQTQVVAPVKKPRRTVKDVIKKIIKDNKED